jgi:hypothetical protein
MRTVNIGTGGGSAVALQTQTLYSSQGTPCESIPTGKNLFSLQGFPCKPLYFTVRDCSVTTFYCCLVYLQCENLRGPRWLMHTLLQRTLYSKDTLCIVTSCSKEQFASNWLVTVCSLTHFTPQHLLLLKTPCSSIHFA